MPDPHVHWWAVPRYIQPVVIGDWTFTDLDFGGHYDHHRWMDVPEEIRQQVAELMQQAMLL